MKEIRYHITPDRYVRRCYAEPGNCPYEESGHYSTKEEALAVKDEREMKQLAERMGKWEVRKEYKDQQKQLVEEYGKAIKPHFERNGKFNESDYKWYMKQFYAIVKLEDGTLVSIEKPSITTNFCFDDSDDYEGAQESARYASTNEDYFTQENMKYLKKQLNLFEETPANLILKRRGSYLTPLVDTISAINYFDNPDEKDRDLSEADQALIAEGYRYALEKHHKRLQTYLKKHGMKHINAWTYWGNR